MYQAQRVDVHQSGRHVPHLQQNQKQTGSSACELAWSSRPLLVNRRMLQQLAALRATCMPGQECSGLRHPAHSHPYREQDGAQVWALGVWVLEQAAVASVGQRA